MENLFIVLKRRENFAVDPIKGQITLFLKKLKQDRVIYREVEIKLKLKEEKNKISKNKNFGEQIELS